MKKALNRGFTLIELLVVIAIIGILASVILASLNSARAKGTDAAVKSDLENARPQAEIYYDGKGNTYLAACTTATSATPGGIMTMLQDASTKAGTGTLITALATPGSATTTVCHDTALGWAAAAPTKSVAAFWCVDSTGVAKQELATAPLAASAVTCP